MVIVHLTTVTKKLSVNTSVYSYFGICLLKTTKRTMPISGHQSKNIFMVIAFKFKINCKQILERGYSMSYIVSTNENKGI